MSLLGYQPDIYQRYAVLVRVARALGTALVPDGPVALLDVGCGPEPLTSRFLGPGFVITRADVDTFGKEDIVRIVPGEPLPFESGSFPLVIAIDTIEHVPGDQRAAFIAECARIASGALLMSCPQGLADVRRAEDLFQDITKTLSGGTGLTFLDEHRDFGLPTREAIVPIFERAMSEVLVFPNAPLNDWIVYSTFDMAYACDFGDSPEKARFNEAVNARLALTGPGDACYRLFFVGTRAGEAADAVRAALDAIANEAAATADDAPLALAEGVARFRDDLRARAAADLKTVHAADRAHIDNLETIVRGLREAIGLKERRIAELQAGLAARTPRMRNRRTEIASLQGAIRMMRDAIDANDRSIEQLKSPPAVRAESRYRRLRMRARDVAARRTVIRSGLFDPAYYLSQTPAAAGAPDPLGHFLSHRGASAGPPHPLFAPAFYVSLYPEVAAANPLVHWVRFGAAEHRRPHPLIDLDDYLARNPDLGAPGIDPLAHYVRLGAQEGRRLTLLFDSAFYLQQNPDVASAGIDPLIHYLSHGWLEGRRPNPFFDPAFYLAKNPDVRDAGLEPLSHFAWAGAREGRRPSEEFDPKSYLAANPDVADAGINPLVHYLEFGRAEGRELALRRTAPAPTKTFLPPVGLLPWFNPLRVELAERLEHEPAINVLLPGLGMRHMSGGPNTALQLAVRLAARGVRTRLVATDAPLDNDLNPLWKHIVGLAGLREAPRALEIADAHDRDTPLVIGQNDLFLATAWWTAQMAKYACRHTRHARFLYLIQDYEPLLHPASTAQTLAEETYGLDYVPIVNSSMLLEYLRAQRIGRFADDAFAARALAFEPAVDRTFFCSESADDGRPRRLLFYTRPNNGLRNLFELGVAALMKAAADGAFEGDSCWEILGIGEAFTPVPLGSGLTLTPAPWLDFAGYAAQMRQSDVLLSLMLSPHPSYPPLEMAACGGRVVTTTFATKTAGRLKELSPNILGAAPTVEGIADAVLDAISDVRRGGGTTDRLNLPSTWDESLGPVIRGLRTALFDWWDVPQSARAGEPKAWPATAYEVERFERLAARSIEIPNAPEQGLLSFLTPVWNTDPGMLRGLAATLLADAAEPRYEWVILDNGSTRPETLAVLADIAAHPAVRVQRSDENLGIIVGLRRLLEIARHRYAAFVDHDDLVTADCARVLSDGIRRRGYPALLYTDEDALLDRTFLRPYRKPGWDPVLFANSCYTAHLSVVDRQLALSLGACTDTATEGSHDWDTFTRFVLAGHQPVHVPEVVYSWRMHAESTAADIAAKPYVLDSQRAVLRRFLDGRGAIDAFEIVESPIIGSHGDWWLRRKPDRSHQTTSVLMGPHPRDSRAPAEHSEVIALDPDIPQFEQLMAAARSCAESDRLIHLLWGGLTISRDAWASEAIGMFELFPDTVMVGGRVCQGDRVIAGAGYFDRRGWESPDIGRRIDDPGYFSHALKPHSVDTVPIWHAVVRPQFLLRALEAIAGIEIHYATLAGWLGAWARRTAGRVVYSPFLEATAPVGLVLPTDPEGQALFDSVHADLFSRQPPRAAKARRAAERTQDARDQMPRYDAWLAARERVRHVHASANGPALSLLTTVYERTDAALLQELADCVLPQLTDRDEWLILAHGAIHPTTDQALRRLSGHSRVRLLERPVNLGIAGGMRVCLEAAEADCVSPVDADDLLSADALSMIRHAFASSRAVLVYSDEDFLIDGRPRAPYPRPDFDPVLDLESSWVWHLCAFDRQAALDAGVYSDTGANYCHDWDTIGRLAATGRPIAHVREVLYHWRQHDASHTNTASVHPGSAASVRHVLERRRAALAHPERFELRPFPLFRGIDEPYLARVAADIPPIGWVRVITPGGRGRASAVDQGQFNLSTIDLAGDPSFVPRLKAQLERWHDAELIALTDAAIEPQSGWLDEPLRLRDLHEQMAICTGRVAGDRDHIVAGPNVLDAAGRACDELAAMSVNDPGPFALALKPHQVALACGHLLVADAGWLRRILQEAPGTIEWADLAAWLSAAAWKTGRWVVYSPLVAGRTTSPLTPVSDGPASRAAVAQLREVLGHHVMGLAGVRRLYSSVRD